MSIISRTRWRVSIVCALFSVGILLLACVVPLSFVASTPAALQYFCQA